jgi:hypothetical protein
MIRESARIASLSYFITFWRVVVHDALARSLQRRPAPQRERQVEEGGRSGREKEGWEKGGKITGKTREDVLPRRLLLA